MTGLPDGWARAAFDNVVESVATVGHVVEANAYADGGSIPVLTQGAAVLDGFTHDTNKAFNLGRSLIVFGDHTRAVKLGNPPFAVGPNTKVLAPSPSLISKFLYYQLPTILPPSRGYGRHYQFLVRSKLAIAPLAEQERIVAAIEEQFSRIDAGSDALRRLPKRLESMRRTLLAATVAAEWPTAALQDVAETRLGKMLSRKSKTGTGELPYVRNQNVQWGRFDLRDVSRMTFDSHERERYRLEAGDLLVCEGGVVGRCAVWEGQLPECYYQKALHRIRPSAAVRAKWIAVVLEHFAYEGLLATHSGGITIQHLPQEDLRRLVIPLPPLQDQDEMISKLEAYTVVSDATRALLIRSEQRARTLRSAVLAYAFLGKLVPQDPKDEPASVLLERTATELTTSNGHKATGVRRPRAAQPKLPA
jgi:type I restriction enzyme S subunit